VAVLEAYKNLDKNMTPADAEKRYLEVEYLKRLLNLTKF